MAPSYPENRGVLNRITVSEALSSVHYGQLSSGDAAAALYCGVPPDLQSILSSDEGRIEELAASGGYVIWSGGIPGHRGLPAPVGLYFIPQPFDAKYVQEHKDTWRHRSGWSKDGVGLLVCCPMEIDDFPLDEQARLLDWLEERTGLHLSLVLLSGDTRPESIRAALRDREDVRPGKSIHGYFSILLLDPRKPADLALWTQIQETLVVLLRSDPAITNPDRLMRYPGVLGTGDTVGPVRIQTVLRTEPVHHDPHDLLAALLALAKEEGIEDIEAAYKALVFAGGLAKKAKDALDDSKLELQQLAATIQQSRAVTAEQRQKAGEMGFGGGHRHSGRRASGSQSCGSTTHVVLDPNTLVTAADGRAHTLREWADLVPDGQKEPCYDPRLESSGRSVPSAVIYDNGTVFSNAGGGRTLYLPDWSSDDPAFTTTDEAEVLDDLVGHLAPAPPPTYLDIDLSQVAEPILVIRAPLGRGKSTWASRVAAQVERWGVVMHRQALGQETARKMRGTCYLDIDPKVEMEIHPDLYPHLVITPNSLHRWQRNDSTDDPIDDAPKGVDLLFVEESESTWAHWYGGTMPRARIEGRPGMVSGDALYHFLGHAEDTYRRGGKIVMMDAYAGTISLVAARIVAERLGLDPEQDVKRVTLAGTVSWRAHRYQQFEDILWAIIFDVSQGNRVVVACSCASDARKLQLLLSARIRACGSKPVVLCHHLEMEDEERNALRNVEVSWASPTVVVFSPTVDSGVSYDLEKAPFHRRYGVFRRPGHGKGGIANFGWDKCVQMTRRVRDNAVTEPDLHIWVDSAWRHDKPMSEEAVRRELLNRAHGGMAALRYYQREDGKVEALPTRDREHFQLGVAVERVRRIRSQNVPRDLFAVLERDGATVVDGPALSQEPRKKLAKLWQDGKALDDERYVNEVLDAIALTTSEYRDLTHHGSTKKAELRSVQRTRHLDMVGAEGLDRQEVLEDRKGGRTRTICRFVRVGLLEDGYKALAAKSDAEVALPGFKASMTTKMMRSIGVLAGLRRAVSRGVVASILEGTAGVPLPDPSSPPILHNPSESKGKKVSQNIGEKGEPDVGSIYRRNAGSPSPVQRLAWANLPRGVTADELRQQVGNPDLVVVEEAIEAIRDLTTSTPVVATYLKGVIDLGTKRSIDILHGLFRWMGLRWAISERPRVTTSLPMRDKSGAVRRLRDGNPKLKTAQVRIYRLDLDALATLHDQASRHNLRARGWFVPAIEAIDPKITFTPDEIPEISDQLLHDLLDEGLSSIGLGKEEEGVFRS